ncbi:MAG TPA: sulfotransferase [Rhodanobacteraceae bacterium]
MTTALQGLDAESRAQLAHAAEALAQGNLRAADAAVRALLDRHPGQPDALLLASRVSERGGDHARAVAAARGVLAQRADDGPALQMLGVALAGAGELDAALTALRRACVVQPHSAHAWFTLGVLCVRAVRFDAADAALPKALELAPQHVRARLQLADVLAMQGRTVDAIGTYRAVLAAHPGCGAAWWGLVVLDATLGAKDIPALQGSIGDPHATTRDRVATGFALAKVLDAEGRCAEALGVLRETHAHAAPLQPWDARAFGSGLDAVLGAFAAPAAPPVDAALGRGVIFIVGLPRSGSTLAEQALASHPQVAASGELPDLPQVLREESQRQRRPYPTWVSALQPADWQRLGERYLQRTARWRNGRACFTDKLPGNWLHVGAIHALLPGAKVVVCRRDPLETCFSCYRQYMTADGQGWTHRFEDLAAYLAGCERAVRHWHELYPGFVYDQRYEDLLADPERSVRALLAFCGLPFESACLDCAGVARVVRSPSAAQVRRPLRATARAPRYGALLDPLRTALGYVDIASAR